MSYFNGKVPQFVLIAVVCFIFYGNTVGNDYAYDDSVVITENRFTREGLAGLPEIFGSNTFRGSYGDNPTVLRYRPLSVATFAIENQFFGLNPHVSHFNNVLLLVLASLVLYEFLSRLFPSREAAADFLDLPLVAVLLFIAHPIHTEVVANIKGRDELMVLTGSMAATLSVLKYLDSREPRHSVWAFVFFLAALFSKENAITFLAIAPLTIYYYKRANWRGYLRALLPLLAASVVYLGVMRLALGATGPLPPQDIITEPFAYATFAERIATAFWTFGVYLRLLVFPHPLTIDYYPYHIQVVNWRNPGVWISVLLCAALTCYALWNLRRKSIVAYGILFFLISFSVVSNLPFSVGTFMSERFVFVPSVGFAIVVAWFLTKTAFAATKHRRLLLAAIALPCLIKTFSRNRQWENDFVLFTSDVKTSSDSIKSNLAASVSYLAESQALADFDLARTYRARALEHSKRAVSLYEHHIDSSRLKETSYIHAITLLGDCYGSNGELDLALQCYKRVISLVPNQEQLCDMIEKTIGKSTDVDFKIARYLDFVELVPDNFLFNYRLGYLYGKEKNELEKSVKYLKRAVDARPDDTHALQALSHAYKLHKDYVRAAFYLERAAAVDPNDPSHLERLLAIYRLAGDREKEGELMNRLGRL